MKTLEGKVTISRDSSDKVRIEVTDELSGLRFVAAKMTCEDWVFGFPGCSLLSRVS